MAGDAVAEIGRADLRDGQSASRNHHLRGVDQPAVAVDLVAAASAGVPSRCAFDAFDAARLPALDTAGGTFGQQQVDDVFSRAVAKQLAFVLFMKWDLVLLQQVYEVLRRVTRQGRAAKVRVLAQELRRGGVAVGEVAAAAARDADFFRDFLAVV